MSKPLQSLKQINKINTKYLITNWGSKMIQEYNYSGGITKIRVIGDYIYLIDSLDSDPYVVKDPNHLR